MEYFQIADMFGKRRRPLLKLYLEEADVVVQSGRPLRTLIIGIENHGRAVAKFPSIQFKRIGGIDIDPYGIDGNHGFGLPQRPSDPQLIIFGGGADHVIYPGSLLKITKLQQYPRPSEWQPAGGGATRLCFEKVTLSALITADEFSSKTETKTISAREA